MTAGEEINRTMAYSAISMETILERQRGRRCFIENLHATSPLRASSEALSWESAFFREVPA